MHAVIQPVRRLGRRGRRMGLSQHVL